MEHRLLRRGLVVYDNVRHTASVLCQKMSMQAAVWPQHRRFVEEEPRQRSMMKKVIPIMVPAWTSCELSVRPDRTGTSPPKVGPSAWPQSLHFLRGAKNKSPSPSVMSSTGCRHCFFVFDPTLSGIGMVRLFVIPSGAARSPNHDSAPPGFGLGTPSPGFGSCSGLGSGAVLRLLLRLPAPAPALLGPC